MASANFTAPQKKTFNAWIVKTSAEDGTPPSPAEIFNWLIDNFGDAVDKYDEIKGN